MDAKSEYVQLANEEGLKIVKALKGDLRAQVAARAKEIRDA